MKKHYLKTLKNLKIMDKRQITNVIIDVIYGDFYLHDNTEISTQILNNLHTLISTTHQQIPPTNCS